MSNFIIGTNSFGEFGQFVLTGYNLDPIYNATQDRIKGFNRFDWPVWFDF